MFWPVTLLGLLIGWLLASIPGALLGGLLGQVVDRRLGLDSWASLRERLAGKSALKGNELLFFLLGRLAKSGGRVSPA
ncbi:MAG TPA: molecular chaperone DjlA, partial [Pseudomonas sp.]|nr:molecular chaperone DjlA [Pseudomonas sp.]